MYLKALRLHGFKSFCDQTTLNFEPGVTAIVGPNGCGKSNLADAIRWVLGEQSAKALRGGKMQDVVFEGTDTRKPAQLCEATLVLTDCERQLGSEFHEIEIMRRVDRDGQSEYYFNGRLCRLKEIQRLFMDTGVGRSSYSIMAQGQIDQILSSKPDERRAVFEEAAGITKYKSQRREAMGKLALTEQNLARVADVVGEVGRQIGSLRRQAAKAMRYKRLSHRLRHLSLALSGWQHGKLTAQLAELDAAVAGLRTAAAERRQSLEARQSGVAEHKERRSRLNQRAQDAQQAVFDLKSQKEAAENAAKLAETRRTGLEERLVSSRDSVSEIEMQIREVAAQADSGAQDRQMQLGLLGSSDAAYQERNRDLAIAEGALSKLEQDLQQAKFELLQFESAVARLRTDASGYEVEQRTSAHRHDALAGELEHIRTERTAAARAAADADQRVGEALSGQDRAKAEVSSGQQALAELTGKFRDEQRRMQEIDRQLAQRGARLKLLQQLQEKWEGFGEGAKAVLQGRADAALQGARPVPITRGLAVKPEFGPAVEALLGSAAEAIGVSDVGTAGRILAQLEQDKLGSVILQISEVAPRASFAAELPPGLVRAADALEQSDPDHPALALLNACYVADDLGSFLAFWREHPDFGFLAVATRKGEVADRRGLVSGGQRDGKKRADGIVQREIDLRETGKALIDDQRQHDEQKARVDAVAAALAAAEQALESRRSELLAVTQAVAGVQTEQRGAVKALAEVDARLARAERELAESATARDDAQARWQRARDGLAEAEAATASTREKITVLESQIAAARADRDGRRDALAQARLELAERRQKVEVIDRGLGEMDRRRSQLSDLLLQRQQEIESWASQVGELERAAAADRARAAQLEETGAVARDQLEGVRRDLVAVEQEIGGLESELAALRTEADAAQGQLSAHEVRLAELRQRAQFLAEEVTREFQADVAGLDWQDLLWHADDEPEGLRALDLDELEEAADPAPSAESKPKGRRARKPKGEPTEADRAALAATDWEQVKAEVDALRQRLSGMGAVNLVAIEEYAELKQRHDFLLAQSGDLTGAKAELIRAIDEINQTSQRQFEVAFEQIRKNFEFTFQTLFGGGRATLELIQAEDVLESGIEIVAQPPGTKLKGITLLSGGQKALTAVALLFALYLVKPSPFCLLDELDAPLDESNIGRFTDLLKKFVPQSQFIIITHNKRTVAAASAIYGVTMEERGVSKTVSMRFNTERGEAEAHPRNLAEAVVEAAAPPA
jgi:chromosome segregation protein